MIGVIYARYSTDRQTENSIAGQVRNCRDRAARDGITVSETYADRGMSGTRADRPAYQRMLLDAQAGRFQVLLVDDLSRLSRDTVEGEQTIRVLEHLGVRIIGVSDNYDSLQDSRELTRGVRNLINEQYVADLRKKTHRGLKERALAQFSAGGRPYGYRTVQGDGGVRWEPDPETAPVVRRIFERYARGDSPRTIAVELNKEGVPPPRGSSWSFTAINPTPKGGILNNTVYLGKVIWNRTQWVKDPRTGVRKRRDRPEEEWVTYQDEGLRIVSPELWERVRARYAQIQRERESNPGKSVGRRKYPLSGLLYCGTCGGKLVMVNRTHYGCVNHKDRGTCPEKRLVGRQAVEESLLHSARDLMTSPEAVRAHIDRVQATWREMQRQPRAVELKKELRDVEGKIANLVRAVAAGTFSPALQQALEGAELRKRELTEEIAVVEKASKLPELKVETIIAHLAEMIKTLPEILERDPVLGREVYTRLFGDRITLRWAVEGDPRADFWLSIGRAAGIDTVGSGGRI